MNELQEKDTLTPSQGSGEEMDTPKEVCGEEERAPEERVPAESQEEKVGEAAPEQVPGEAVSGSKAPEETPKTVFAPLPWEKVPGGDSRKKEKARLREERTREQAQEQARRQEEKAEKEARLLEARLERENRKAQEEQRRQEEKERREEERTLRKEEKARQKTVRRVGTMTLGVALIAIGAAILAYMVNPNFNLQMVAYLAPVILISLGLEVLIRYFFSKDRTYKYDFVSGIICIFLVAGSFGVAAVPYVMYYVSPDRFAAENTLIQDVDDKVYQAFQGDQRVKDYYVNGGVGTDGPYAQRDEKGNWIYELDYLHLHVNLLYSCADEAEFTEVCRDLIDALAAQGLTGDGGLYLSFQAPENDEGIRYELNLDNRLQLEMDSQHLMELVTPIYSQPTLENGWLPGGYEEIAADYGYLMADHFAILLEDYSGEDAQLYYDLLYASGEAAAEGYYSYVTGEDVAVSEEGQEPPPPEAAESAASVESAPVEESSADSVVDYGTETAPAPSLAASA